MGFLSPAAAPVTIYTCVPSFSSVAPQQCNDVVSDFTHPSSRSERGIGYHEIREGIVIAGIMNC